MTTSGGLAYALEAGAILTGTAVDKSAITLITTKEYPSGTDILDLRYNTFTAPDHNVHCFVGGNPNPETTGCLEEMGSLYYDQTYRIGYTYNLHSQNMNYRHIQALSTRADVRMKPDGKVNHEYYDFFGQFVDYYGQHDFADHWIENVFNKKDVKFEKWLADFRHITDESRAKTIGLAIRYLIINQFVLRSLEYSVYECWNHCREDVCTDMHLVHLDEAVAYYTGALEGKDGFGEGNLAYSLADEMCPHFRTCGETGDLHQGQSKVNIEIFKAFKSAQEALQLSNSCDVVKKAKDIVETQMKVPIIQSILWTSNNIQGEKELSDDAAAALATSSMALLPSVHACSAKIASSLYSLTKWDNKVQDYAVMKEALQDTYTCLRVTCADVGGIWSTRMWKFLEGKEPCDEWHLNKTKLQKAEEDLAAGIKFLIAAGSIVGVVLMFLAYRGRQAMLRRKYMREHGINYDSDSDSDDGEMGEFT